MSIRPARPNADFIDDDVLREKRYIFAMSERHRNRQILVLDNVSKYYGRFLAVNQISLCVKKKECFGLLGLNGAGKTTTFKMITGDESITIGSGYVTGLNITTNMEKIYKKIGYCPQSDALLGDFAGRETLKIYCLLRGIRRKRITLLSEELAKSYGFFMGSPLAIFLDEPTAGMDPESKRQVWNMICRVRDAGSSIILTSHSMDEIEALCTRLTIMVNGEFKCIGSLQHLKNKFSRGFVLKIKVKSEQDMHELTAPRQEEHQDMLTFYIPLDSIKWSKIFGIMENNRAALSIVDYSINQTRLEEIFLEMAKTQVDDKRLNTQKKGWCYLM